MFYICDKVVCTEINKHPTCYLLYSERKYHPLYWGEWGWQQDTTDGTLQQGTKNLWLAKAPHTTRSIQPSGNNPTLPTATTTPPRPGHRWVTSVGYYILDCIHSVSAKTSTNSKSSTLRTQWHEHCFNYGTNCSLVLDNFIVVCLSCCDRGGQHTASLLPTRLTPLTSDLAWPAVGVEWCVSGCRGRLWLLDLFPCYIQGDSMHWHSHLSNLIYSFWKF